jgi:aerobic carbon-monoxide dehydrogenase medium subunit
VIPGPVGYIRAETIDQALAELVDPEAKILAGGHSLVPMMKLRLAHPSLLVDIGRLELRDVVRTDATVSIGTLTRYDDLLNLSGVALPSALLEAASSVGDVQVRNAGTIGGALAHGDPACDIAAAVLALGARLRLRSPAGERECAAEEMFLAPFTTALDQQELLVDVTIPLPRPGEGSAYRSIDDPASGYPLAGAAVRLRLQGEQIDECAIGLTGAASAPTRLASVEEALRRAPADAAVVAVREAVADVSLGAATNRDDHRRQLVVTAITRAYLAARDDARKGELR